MSRLCTKCKHYYPEDQFTKSKPWCKSCIKEYNKKYYDKNKDLRHEQDKQYYAEHRESKIKYQSRLQTSKTKYFNGVLTPNISVSTGRITERLVSIVLNDCEIQPFNAPFDLYSDSMGTINVKASKLCLSKTTPCWQFYKNTGAFIPDYYICLGMNQNKSRILHVWKVMGDAPEVGKTGFSVYNTNNSISKFKKYEVDERQYNMEYQNLDLKEIPEFQNL